MPNDRLIIWIIAVIASVVASLLYAMKVKGGDLAPLVIAARLMLRGGPTGLFARGGDALLVDDPAWIAEAADIGYAGILFPFVYPPLVAYAFMPLAQIDFPLLCRLAIPVFVAALGAIVFLSVRQWAPVWMQPRPLLALLFGLLVSFPFLAGADALNIQVFIVLLVVIAMAASQNARPRVAGLALAAAAFVKLVPGVVAIYWLFARRYDCVGWFAAAWVVLVAANVAVCGVPASLEYFENLRELSSALVPILTNKGIPNLLFGLATPLDRVETYNIVPLPTWIALANSIVLIVALGLVLRGARHYRHDRAFDAAGMSAAFLVATMASSMAWSHVYIFLVVAVVIWGGMQRDAAMQWALPLVVWALASVFFKLATEWLSLRGTPEWLVGGELLAGVVLVAGIVWTRHRGLNSVPAGITDNDLVVDLSDRAGSQRTT
jgi:hypothetical protein